MKFKFLVVGLVCSLSVASMLNAADGDEARRERVELAENYNDPHEEIPENLRSGLGVGVVRLFKVEGEYYIILGERFLEKDLYWKYRGGEKMTSVSGAVGEGDRTALDGIKRETNRKWFNQLPYNNNLTFDHPKRIVRGYENYDDSKEVDGGRCIIFYTVDAKYSLDDLRNAVRIMNDNAKLHVPIVDFCISRYWATCRDGDSSLSDEYDTDSSLSDEYDTESSLSEVANQASDIIDGFNRVRDNDKIVPLSEEVKDVLNSIANGCDTHPDEGWYYFMVKHFNYVESKNFELVRFDEFMSPDLKMFFEEERQAAAALVESDRSAE